MARRMLADVLWEAANVWLWDGQGSTFPDANAAASCCAAYIAEKGREWGYYHDRWDEAAKSSKAVSFMRDLGCDVGVTHFEDAPSWSESQGNRYMWLLLAMHVAQDEGIEV